MQEKFDVYMVYDLLEAPDCQVRSGHHSVASKLVRAEDGPVQVLQPHRHRKVSLKLTSKTKKIVPRECGGVFWAGYRRVDSYPVDAKAMFQALAASGGIRLNHNTKKGKQHTELMIEADWPDFEDAQGVMDDCVDKYVVIALMFLVRFVTVDGREKSCPIRALLFGVFSRYVYQCVKKSSPKRTV